MNNNYLLPHKFKKMGFFMLIPSAILGFLALVFEYEPNYLDFNVPAIFLDDIFENKVVFGMVDNNILNEIFGILIIVSSLFVAFSKEKLEDEYISKIRLESLVWSVYANYGILLFSFAFIYGFSFLWVMIFNMFTILLFFIIRFNWQISKLKKAALYEE
ncbi:hypothetical protein [Cellulophaga sp. L1A9]|uniref:hypothetical protein n=1 Tax=Cellulophaga sp. L1A9 TaxID=2686362 RepID=UPI00131BA2A9|nr:hypothetical protein [Cellulophaga sp. L1A9]